MLEDLKVKSEKVQNIITGLKTLSLTEAIELISTIEETFGVCVSETVATAAVAMSTANPIVQEVEEKTEFNVTLEEFPPDQKIAILKVVRTLTGFGLKESKALVESVPKVIQEDVSKEVAEDSKNQLEAAGAKVSLT